MLNLQVDHLTKYYGKEVGVKDISFAVEEGEIFGFLGPNGSGKTTTIRLIMQLLTADAGSISLFNQKMDRQKTGLFNRVGYLPGEFEAYKQMSGQRYLDYIASFRQRPPILMDQLLSHFKISSDDLSKKIKEYSHGMRQKLGLVQALNHDPDLLILDEPTLGLDPMMQYALYDFLEDFQTRDKTVFLSSHILSEVERICRRVAIIRNGSIVALESLHNMKKRKRRHLTIFVDKENPIETPVLTGADLLNEKSGQYEYLVSGDINPILNQLTKIKLIDLQIEDAKLEDVFMAYYQEPKS